MALSLDPTLRDLNDCGCCEGITAETPAAVTNRPGLSAVAYRIGEHATFKASMLAALSATDNAQLQALKTRAPDDFTVALTDAWAAALDVLTFYQERIANESYLRTATERLSVLHLARLIGYELRPGVAASTALAFTLDETAGSPVALTLEAGLKVQSIPGPGEQPQTFETVEPIEARPRWNAIRPRQTAPQTLAAGMNTLWLSGTDANLRPGDRLLIVGAKSGGGFEAGLRRVQRVDKDDPNKRTLVSLETLDYGPTPVAATAPGVWAMRAKPGAFGHNAPKKPDPKALGNPAAAGEWDLDSADTTDLKLLSLDAVYDQIVVGGWVVVDRPASLWSVIEYAQFEAPALHFISERGAATEKMALAPISVSPWVLGSPGFESLLGSDREQIFAHVQSVGTLSRASYGITGRVTQLGLDVAWLRLGDSDLSVLRDASICAQSEALTLAEAPLGEALPVNDIMLNGDYSELMPGDRVGFSGQLAGSAADSPRVSELAEIKSLATAGGFTALTLAKNLTNSFRRASTTVNANVALATHGETVSEVLGSGNGSQAYQRFALRQSPLTYVSAQTPDGAASTLQVRVNDVLWREAQVLFGRGPRDRVYTISAGDDGKVTLLFGDGATGARLPSGTENVKATYRKGIGKAGNVAGGQISLLMSRPLGLREAINPTPATGGDDPEPRERARVNAPLTVMTLGRIVSLRDYEDFARAFAGVAKALATWTWDGERQGVFVTIAGVDGVPIAETSETFKNLVAAMHDAGDPYVPLRVKSYAAAPFRLAAAVTRDPDYLADKVDADVMAALLSAFAFDARAFGQPVALSEVMAAIQIVPGVVALAVNALHRLDLVGGGGVQDRLPASVPQSGTGGTPSPAELLMLAAGDIDLAVT
jgi:uncharacterized phage protein gp47/JayE